MTTFEKTAEEIEIGNTKYLVFITHREWNPLPGTTPPDGTVWVLETKFSYLGVDEGRNVVAQGCTKEEAIRNLFLQIGFHSGVAAMKWGAMQAEPADEHNLGEPD